MENVSVLAITKNGIKIGEKLKGLYPNWNIFAPEKLSNKNNEIIWYSEGTTNKIIELFKNSNAYFLQNSSKKQLFSNCRKY